MKTHMLIHSLRSLCLETVFSEFNRDRIGIESEILNSWVRLTV